MATSIAAGLNLSTFHMNAGFTGGRIGKPQSMWYNSAQSRRGATHGQSRQARPRSKEAKEGEGQNRACEITLRTYPAETCDSGRADSTRAALTATKMVVLPL